MRGYLKSPNHTYQLDDDVITIGKGSGKNKGKAHIPLNNVHAESLHAKIEKDEENGYYALVDLTPECDTFVNDQRMKTKRIKLVNGDVVRFGKSGEPHELTVQFVENVKTSSRASSGSRLTSTPSPLLPQPPLSEVCKRLNLPMSAGGSSSGVGTDITFRPDTAPQKREDVSRPGVGDRSRSVPFDMKLTQSNVKQKENVDNISTGNQEPWYVEMLREKENRILSMGDEISRLLMFEKEVERKDFLLNEAREKNKILEQQLYDLHATTISEQNEHLEKLKDQNTSLFAYKTESERKDKVIVDLRHENAILEAQVGILQQQEPIPTENEQEAANAVKDEIDSSQYFVKKMSIVSDKSVSFEDKLESLQEDFNKTNKEADSLREKFDKIVPEKLTPEIEVLKMKDEIDEKNEKIFELKDQIVNLQKEYSMAQGLATSLQRNIQQKDNEIRKMKMTEEKLKIIKQELQDQVNLMSGKFSSMRKEKSQIQMLASVEMNLQKTRDQLHLSNNNSFKLQEKVDKQSREIRKYHKQVRQYIETEKRLLQDIDILTNERDEANRMKQLCQVSLEQTTARFERIRSSTIQSVFSAPGSVKLENLVSDEEVINALSQVLRDRTEFHTQLLEAGHEPPPLLVVLDSTPEEDAKKDDTVQNRLAPNNEKKGKGGRKSPKSK